MTGFAFLLVLGADASVPRVTVEGTTVCPSPTEVEKQLQRLLPSLDGSEGAKVAHISDHAGGIHIVLRHNVLGPIADRTLARAASCADMAANVALTIAAWDSDVNAEFLSALPAWPLHSENGAATDSSLRATPVALPLSRPFAYDIGFGVADSWWGSWGAVFLGRATVTPGQRGLGFTLFAAWDTPRWMPVASAGARWQRWSAGVGVHHRTRLYDLVLDLRAEVGVARMSVMGVGFAENYHTVGLEPEVAVGVRLGLPFLRSRVQLLPWLELGVTAWPVRPRAVELPSDGGRAVPPLAVILAAGLSFGHFR